VAKTGADLKSDAKALPRGDWRRMPEAFPVWEVAHLVVQQLPEQQSPVEAA
jgi:hypothetical protein